MRLESGVTSNLSPDPGTNPRTDPLADILKEKRALFKRAAMNFQIISDYREKYVESNLAVQQHLMQIPVVCQYGTFIRRAAHWNFQFKMFTPCSYFDSVSIAHPLIDDTEFALIKDGQCVYCSDAGYDDVCRFSSLEEVVAELLRLAKFADTMASPAK